MGVSSLIVPTLNLVGEPFQHVRTHKIPRFTVKSMIVHFEIISNKPYGFNKYNFLNAILCVLAVILNAIIFDDCIQFIYNI